MLMNYDAAVIGGGPAGYTAALGLANGNRTVVLFEGAKAGGTCLHKGCIPMKSLLHNGPQMTAREALVKAGEDVSILYKGLCSQLRKPGIDLVGAFCKIHGRTGRGFEIEAAGDVYSASALMIATGSEQDIPKIDGLEKGIKEGWVLDTDAFFSFDAWGRNVAVIGAGASGLEIASYLSKLGVKVVVIEAADDILSGGMDDDVYEIYAKELAGIEVICSASVCEVDKHVVAYQYAGRFEELEADQVVAASGRKARIGNIGLGEIGVQIVDGFIPVDSHCMTNIDGVYACGDVVGKDMLAHAAYREAEAAVAHICGYTDGIEYDAVPKVVFTDPEYASVGASEKMLLKEGKKKGADYFICKGSMAYSSRYVILEGKRPGVCKFIFDYKGTLMVRKYLGMGPVS